MHTVASPTSSPRRSDLVRGAVDRPGLDGPGVRHLHVAEAVLLRAQAAAGERHFVHLATRRWARSLARVLRQRTVQSHYGNQEEGKMQNRFAATRIQLFNYHFRVRPATLGRAPIL